MTGKNCLKAVRLGCCTRLPRGKIRNEGNTVCGTARADISLGTKEMKRGKARSWWGFHTGIHLALPGK